MNYCLCKIDPNVAKHLKSGQNVSRSGQKKIFMMSYTHMNKDPQNPIQLLQGYGLERQYLRLSDFLVVLVDEQHSDTV